MNGLSAPERETVVNWSDVDDCVQIWSAQRPVITKLKANPGAELIAEGRIGTSVWAEFRLPLGLLTFRRPRKPLTEAQRRKKAAVLARNRKRKATK
jgi:hypothetical protein